MLTITVDNELPDPSTTRLPPGSQIQLQLAQPRISVAQLIAQAVATQLLLLRASAHAALQQATESTPADPVLDEQQIARGLRLGRVALDSNPRQAATVQWQAAQALQTEHEVQRALHAFRAREFQVVVDGCLHTDPDAMLDLTQDSQVLFMRLMPLRGG